MENYKNIERIKEAYRTKLSESEHRGLIQRAELFVVAHLYKSKLTIGWMEKQCHIHSKVFPTNFAIATGFTPKAYILHHRIATAKLLLRQTEAPVMTIALSVGFSSLAAFDNAFKHSEGKRPSVWRGEGG